MFDNCIMMINIYNKLFNSLFTNKELAQDTSHSACANKKKVLEFTFWTTLLSPASWSLHVGAVQVWSEISALVVTPMGPSLFPHEAPQMPAQKPRWVGEGVSLCTSIHWELQDATHWSSSVLRAQWQPQHWMGSWAVKTATSLPLFLVPWRFRWGISGITEEN